MFRTAVTSEIQIVDQFLAGIGIAVLADRHNGAVIQFDFVASYEACVGQIDKKCPVTKNKPARGKHTLKLI